MEKQEYNHSTNMPLKMETPLKIWGSESRYTQATMPPANMSNTENSSLRSNASLELSPLIDSKEIEGSNQTLLKSILKVKKESLTMDDHSSQSELPLDSEELVGCTDSKDPLGMIKGKMSTDLHLDSSSSEVINSTRSTTTVPKEMEINRLSPVVALECLSFPATFSGYKSTNVSFNKRVKDTRNRYTEEYGQQVHVIRYEH